MSDPKPVYTLNTDEFAALVKRCVREELAEHPEAPQFLKRRELAKMLDTSEKTIARLMKEGLPAERLGSEWRFELGKVREFMRTRKKAG